MSSPESSFHTETACEVTLDTLEAKEAEDESEALDEAIVLTAQSWELILSIVSA